jgi:3-dehydrosphinganine reductase
MSLRKHALITGGSSGIGLALAKELVQSGYNVSLIARGKDALQRADRELRAHVVAPDQRVYIHPADVADREQASAAAEASINALGAPELVFTSAGIAVPGYFQDMSTDVFERSMAVNYFGTLYVVRAVLPAMRRQRCGRIVLISSGAALMGIFGYGSYGPSKFAVRGLAETLRAELSRDNVGVSVVYPPDTATPMLEEENKTKPAETKLITALAKTWTAEAVAKCIMRGVRRGRFAITPGSTVTLMHRCPGMIIPLLRWYCDRLVRSVRPDRAAKSISLGEASHASHP